MQQGQVFIIFPHQLFADIALLQQASQVYLVEEFLFFNQYQFHQQKLLLHRSSMQYYKDYLLANGIALSYIEALSHESDIRVLIGKLHQQQVKSIACYDVCDDWLDQRLQKTCKKLSITFTEYDSPLFINNKASLQAYFGTRTKFFQTEFYIYERKRLNILLQEDQKPLGGQWTFDTDNRKKYPKGKIPPAVYYPETNSYHLEALAYVRLHYPNNHGQASEQARYPCTHTQSEAWLQQFFEQRFAEFGAYEDAILADDSIIHHSVISPLLNIGLLLPMQVVQAALNYAQQHQVPLNSLEGFIRQIIGWREFIRAVYLYKGSEERTRNFWQFDKTMPQALYQGSTGITPVDFCIKKMLQSAYNHHIERLMVLGNFMLLNEIHPDEVYRWFMEMYIDAYDWVMVPNVYGMSQFADGGMMATKPYISGSSYLLKMSNYPKGDWCTTWDALFWRFMDRHRAFFLSNPRLSMLVHSYDKMSDDKKQTLQANWQRFSLS